MAAARRKGSRQGDAPTAVTRGLSHETHLAKMDKKNILLWAASRCPSTCKHGGWCRRSIQQSFRSDALFVEHIQDLRQTRAHRKHDATSKGRFTHSEHAHALYDNSTVHHVAVCVRVAGEAHGHTRFCMNRVYAMRSMNELNPASVGVAHSLRDMKSSGVAKALSSGYAYSVAGESVRVWLLGNVLR
jgi:hypothetical protein